jgi:murein DD-endopeptidase MepM/ murein hydrolase activator NlpD
MANASFFSDLFGGGQAQADDSASITPVNNDNSQNVDLLATESVNPDIKNSDTQTDPIIEQGGSFIYNDGLSETDVKALGLEKSPISDQIGVYTVKEGDTLSEIADTFGISTNTIRWENNISGQTISIGQKLNILPMTGVKHIVKKGDTVSKIADKYEADPQDILIFNGISKGDALNQGDIVFVPNGIIKPVITKPSSGAGSVFASNTTKVQSGYYIRPVPGPVTSPYGSRHGSFHPGVDLGGARGTPIEAAASGIVIASVNGCVEGRRSCGGGYGNHVDIAHPNGTMTRYGHMTMAIVSVGQSVTQGEEIGTLGSTGNSTGPHVHFEIRNSNGSTMRPPV